MTKNRHKIIVLGNSQLLPKGKGTDYKATELDLPQGFGLLMQRSVEELNELNQIKRIGALDFDLPRTRTNDTVFDRFRRFGIVDNTYLPMSVQVWVNDKLLPFDTLKVTLASDRDKSYSCEVSNEGDIWIELAEDKKLVDLQTLGNFTFTTANVLDNMQNGGQYLADPDSIIYCPLADFGGKVIEFTSDNVYLDDEDSPNGNENVLHIPDHGIPVDTGLAYQCIFTTDGSLPRPIEPNTLVPIYVADDSDLVVAINVLGNKGTGNHTLYTMQYGVPDIRPLFSVPALLKKGFLEIGWRLEGEILSHPKVSRWWQYILSRDYYATGGNQDIYFTQAVTDVDRDYDSIPPAPLGDYIDLSPYIQQELGTFQPDPTNATFPDVYMNTTGTRKNIVATLVIPIELVSAGTVTFSAQLDIRNTSDIPKIRSTESITLSSSSPTGTITVTVEGEMLHREYITVFVFTSATNVQYKVKAGTSFNVQPKEEPKYIVEGSTHQLALMIDEDLTLLDILNGFVHLCDLKFQTNYQEKIVTVYPSKDTDFFGTELKGFYKPSAEAKDVGDIVEVGSMSASYPTEDNPRDVLLKFRDSTDGYIESETLSTEESPIFSRLVDLGEQNRGERLVLENPLYEPTAERQVGSLNLPVLWGDDEGKLRYGQKPRIFYAVGWVKQMLSQKFTSRFDTTPAAVPLYTVDTSFYYFGGTRYENLAYASQVPRSGISGGSTPTDLIAYGTDANDLYTAFWEKARFLRFSLPDVAFLVRLSLTDFLGEDFRRRWRVEYGGRTNVFQILRFLEHNTADDSSTEVVLLPEAQATD